MRYVIAIILLFICHPGMAAKHRHKRHHHSHHRIVHHAHNRHHRVAVHPAKPKVLTVDDLLSQEFEAQKGSLRAPVEGTPVHIDTAAIKYHVYQPTLGIDLNCKAGSCVRSVHEGVVSNVFSVDGDENKVVIVKHGNYFTVYNGVAHTAVKKGDQVSGNQELGTIAANDDGEPRLNFQIWKAAPGKSEKTKLDPEAWIIKNY